MKENILHPNYDLIRKYLNDPIVNETYFNGIRTSKGFEGGYYETCQKLEVKRTGKRVKITDPDVAFFWVYFYDNYCNARWSKDIELYKASKSYNKQLQELKSLFDNINLEKAGKAKANLISITIKARKDKHLHIDSYSLLLDMCRYLEPWIIEQKVKMPDVKSVATYERNFIRSTKPYFEYHRAKGANSEQGYDEVVKILDMIGFVWDGEGTRKKKRIPALYVKECYRERE